MENQFISAFFNKNKSNSDSEQLGHINSESFDDLIVPDHIAMIMDGNGRWAKQRGLSRSEGHSEGAKTLYSIVDFCRKINLKYLTVYAFSTENWLRPKKEVDFLMSLLKNMFNKYIKEIVDGNIRIRVLGDKNNIPKNTLRIIEKAEKQSQNNTGLQLIIAFNYGGRREIATAAKEIAKAYANGDINLDEINEDSFHNYLYLPDVPDPDLIIRSSGEMRISNFLLWQLAYSEFWVSDILWPDFKPENLVEAIRDFNNRDRRYGGIK